MTINPNPNSKFSGGLAALLLPSTNFAQRRADAAANLQLSQLDQQQMAQAAEQKTAALAEVQQTLSAVDEAKLLGPDRRRLNEALAEPFRQRVETELRDQYGGDVARYQRERGDYMAKQFARQLTSHPLFSQATRNMANYALAQDAIQKGKIVVGDFDKNRLDFEQGRTNTLNFQGAYDAPDNVWDYFDKTPSAKGEFGEWVRGGKKEAYRPYEVSKEDLRGHLLSQKMSPVEVDDYMRRLNYQGGRFWKQNKQSPWDATEQTQNAGFRQQQLGIQQQDLGLRREAMQMSRENHSLDLDYKRAQIGKLNADAASKSGDVAGSATNIVQQVFTPPAENLKTVHVSGKPLEVNGRPVLRGPGVGGKLGDALARTVGIASATPELDNANSNAVLSIPSSLTRVQDRWGRTHQSSDGKPIRFQSVDTNHIYYIGTGRAGGAGAENRVPHIAAIALINDKPQEVLLPLPNNDLVKGELVNQANIYASDEKRAQAQMAPYMTPAAAPAESNPYDPQP